MPANNTPSELNALYLHHIYSKASFTFSFTSGPLEDRVHVVPIHKKASSATASLPDLAHIQKLSGILKAKGR